MSKSTPFFSVIIPTRNRADLLKRCIQSVLEQSFENWELIVVDDGSTDHTTEIINSNKDPRIKYIYQDHSERSTARNTGISNAQGLYVCFIDDDDFVLNNHLECFYSYYQSSEDKNIILRCGYSKKIGDSSKKAPNYQAAKHKNPVKFAAYYMCGVWTLAIPRNFLSKNSFPEQFPHWQDTHLILRLLAEHPFVQLNCYTYVYVIHDNMGSVKATSYYDALERADLNVSAIKDLFHKYGDQIHSYLPKNTLKFLIAEKYIQYYLNDFHHRKSFNKALFRRSMSQGVYFKLWKYYLLVIKARMGF